MTRRPGWLVLLAIMTAWLHPGQAQEPKHGGVLHVFHRDSPASPSILEESSDSVTAPFMAVFNNLVVFDPDSPQNRLDRILPDLATS